MAQRVIDCYLHYHFPLLCRKYVLVDDPVPGTIRYSGRTNDQVFLTWALISSYIPGELEWNLGISDIPVAVNFAFSRTFSR